jgi:hypothetical protein
MSECAPFEALIQDWAGILVSDGYGVYCKWIDRQTCLVHLIRKARELSERQTPELARFGAWALAELERLHRMARAQPSLGEWQAFYARFIRLIVLNRDRPDAAGRLARNLQREMDSLSHQQSCGAHAALCRALAQEVPGNGERQGQSLGGEESLREANVPPPNPECVRCPG